MAPEAESLVYRSITPADEASLRRMLYLAIFVPPGAASPDPGIVDQPEIARYVQGWGRAHDDGLVAVDGSMHRVVGASWLRVWTSQERGYGFVDERTPELSMAVEPEWRGCGVGTRLLHELLVRADRVHPAVSLSVSIRNPALRLYRRFGFEVLDGRQDAVTMRRARIGRPSPA